MDNQNNEATVSQPNEILQFISRPECCSFEPFNLFQAIDIGIVYADIFKFKKLKLVNDAGQFR